MDGNILVTHSKTHPCICTCIHLKKNTIRLQVIFPIGLLQFSSLIVFNCRDFHHLLFRINWKDIFHSRSSQVLKSFTSIYSLLSRVDCIFQWPDSIFCKTLIPFIRSNFSLFCPLILFSTQLHTLLVLFLLTSDNEMKAKSVSREVIQSPSTLDFFISFSLFFFFFFFLNLVKKKPILSCSPFTNRQKYLLDLM